MRTNIDIDDEIMKKAMVISGVKTKKAMVEKALQEFVTFHSQKNLLDLKGKIKFSEGYDYKALRKGTR
jgi:Arc/MetJ family transcription regulator